MLDDDHSTPDENEQDLRDLIERQRERLAAFADLLLGLGFEADELLAV